MAQPAASLAARMPLALLPKPLLSGEGMPFCPQGWGSLRNSMTLFPPISYTVAFKKFPIWAGERKKARQRDHGDCLFAQLNYDHLPVT